MDPRPAGGTHRWRLALALLSLGLCAAVLTSTRLELTGRLAGLFLLRAPHGLGLELRDDLKLGEEERLLGGVAFPVKDPAAPAGRTSLPAGPRLVLEWDRADGSGLVTNLLADGRRLETDFGRYLFDDGRPVHGLFVGGARASTLLEVRLNESGMSLGDADGWHHLWCTVNEAIRVEGDDRLFLPPDWTLLASRVLIDSPERVLLESEHRLEAAGARLSMHRHVHFQAGQPWFRLDVRFTNLGERPVSLTYGYGDEPWVGRFGSAEGNLGWTRAGVVPVAGRLDPRVERWAGIVDGRTGLANFIAWTDAPPDLAYFNNHAGPPTAAETGAPLASNEVFIGLEWQRRRLEPSGELWLSLSIGLAGRAPDGRPMSPLR